jgi:hypothetical protein
MNYIFEDFCNLSGNRKKVGHLWKLPGANERLQLVRADLLEEGSFDDAVRACEGVFHIASPVLGKSDSNCKACCICFKYLTLLSPPCHARKHSIHFAGSNTWSCNQWYPQRAKIVQEESISQKGCPNIFLIRGKD